MIGVGDSMEGILGVHHIDGLRSDMIDGVMESNMVGITTVGDIMDTTVMVGITIMVGITTMGITQTDTIELLTLMVEEVV